MDAPYFHETKWRKLQTVRYQNANNVCNKESVTLILIMWIYIVKNHPIDANILPMSAKMTIVVAQVGHSRANVPQI